MSNDPFGGNPFATQTVINAGDPMPEEATPMTTNATPPSSSEALFSYTTKVGSNLLTARGQSIDEFKANLESLESVIEQCKKLNGLGMSGSPAMAAPTAAPAAPASTPAPQRVASPTAPGGPAKTCAHGAMVYEEWGTNSFNPQFPNRAWKCPVAVEAQDWKAPGSCKTVWVNPPK